MQLWGRSHSKLLIYYHIQNIFNIGLALDVKAEEHDDTGILTDDSNDIPNALILKTRLLKSVADQVHWTYEQNAQTGCVCTCVGDTRDDNRCSHTEVKPKRPGNYRP